MDPTFSPTEATPPEAVAESFLAPGPETQKPSTAVPGPRGGAGGVGADGVATPPAGGSPASLALPPGVAPLAPMRLGSMSPLIIASGPADPAVRAVDDADGAGGAPPSADAAFGGTLGYGTPPPQRPVTSNQQEKTGSGSGPRVPTTANSATIVAGTPVAGRPTTQPTATPKTDSKPSNAKAALEKARQRDDATSSDGASDGGNDSDDDDDFGSPRRRRAEGDKAPIEIVVDRSLLDSRRPVLTVPNSMYQILFIDPTYHDSVVPQHGFIAMRSDGCVRKRANKLLMKEARKIHIDPVLLQEAETLEAKRLLAVAQEEAAAAAEKSNKGGKGARGRGGGDKSPRAVASGSGGVSPTNGGGGDVLDAQAWEAHMAEAAADGTDLWGIDPLALAGGGGGDSPASINGIGTTNALNQGVMHGSLEHTGRSTGRDGDSPRNVKFHDGNEHTVVSVAAADTDLQSLGTSPQLTPRHKIGGTKFGTSPSQSPKDRSPANNKALVPASKAVTKVPALTEEDIARANALTLDRKRTSLVAQARVNIGHRDPTFQRYFRPTGAVAQQHVFFEDAIFDEDLDALKMLCGANEAEEEHEIYDIAGVKRPKAPADYDPNSEDHTYRTQSKVLDALKVALAADMSRFFHDGRRADATEAQRLMEEMMKKPVLVDVPPVVMEDQAEASFLSPPPPKPRPKTLLSSPRADPETPADVPPPQPEDEVEQPPATEEISDVMRAKIERRKLLHKEVKKWRKKYAKAHGGEEPTHDVLSTDEEIKYAYEEYVQLKLETADAETLLGLQRKLDEAEGIASPDYAASPDGTAAADDGAGAGAPMPQITVAPDDSASPTSRRLAALPDVGSDASPSVERYSRALPTDAEERRAAKALLRPMVAKMKKWKNNFRAIYGREPAAADMLADFDISDTYLQLRQRFGTDEPAISEDEDEAETRAAREMAKRRRVLTRQMRTWRDAFTERTGSVPGVDDIADDIEMRAVYEEWLSVGGVGEPLPPPQGELDAQAAADAAAAAEAEAAPLETAGLDLRAQQKRRKQLNRELNNWKMHFKDEHGREPTHADINADPDVRALFLEYQSIPKFGGTGTGGGNRGGGNAGDDDEDAVPQDISAVSAAASGQPLVDNSAPTPARRRRQLARELNAWKRQFKEDNGREPSQDDIKFDPAILSLFEEFNSIPKSAVGIAAPIEGMTPDRDGAGGASPPSATTPQTTAARRKQLAKKLNAWKATFAAANGREATMDDIDLDASAAATYAEYLSLKKGGGGAGSARASDGGAGADSPGDGAAGIDGSPDIAEQATTKERHRAHRALNAWKKTFAEAHDGREPTAVDIAADVEGSRLLSAYTALKVAGSLDDSPGGALALPPAGDSKKAIVARLNAWKDNFLKTRGRPATQSDILADATIRPDYEKYMAAKGRGKSTEEADAPAVNTEAAAQARKKLLGKRILAWKAAFKAEHDRDPVTSDINADAEMSALYAEYTALKAASSTAGVTGGDAETTPQAVALPPALVPVTSPAMVVSQPSAAGASAAADVTTTPIRDDGVSADIAASPAPASDTAGTEQLSAADQQAAATKHRISELNKRLNAWKREYKATHGSDPTTKHINADVEMKAVFEEYLALKQGGVYEPQRQRAVSISLPSPDGTTDAAVAASASGATSRRDSSAAPAGSEATTAAATKERIAALNSQLNAWKRQFIADKGRQPTPSDINADPEMKALFEEYTTLKRGSSATAAPVRAADAEVAAGTEGSRRASTVTGSNGERQAALNRQLNEWRAAFAAANDGRAPTASDLRAVPEMLAVYEEYTALKALSKSTGDVDAAPVATGGSAAPQAAVTAGPDEQAAAPLEPSDQAADPTQAARSAPASESPAVSRDDEDEAAQIAARVKVLNRQLQQWKTQFAAENGRAPTATDISANAPMKAAFDEYTDLKKKQKASGAA